MFGTMPFSTVLTASYLPGVHLMYHTMHAWALRNLLKTLAEM